MKTVSGRMVRTTMACSVIVVAPRRDRDPVAVGDAVLLGQPRMDLEPRLGILIDQRADPARLRAGEVLADHAAGGQVDGNVVVHRIAALAPLGDA